MSSNKKLKLHFVLVHVLKEEGGGARDIKIDIKKAKTYKPWLSKQIIPTHTKGIHKI